jgi:hypothetical protein
VPAGDWKKDLRGHISVEAKDRWEAASARHGVSMSALLEVLSRHLHEPAIDMAQVVEEARQVDTDNRRRRHQPEDEGP